MTSKTTDDTTEATVTEISTAKGKSSSATRKSTTPRNRTARRQQLDDAAALARAEANAAAGEAALVAAITPEARADETRADAQRAGLSDEAAESLVAAQAAALAADSAADPATTVDQPQGDATATDKPAQRVRGRAERVARVDVAGDVVPEGYLAAKDTPSYRQFRKADPTAEGAEWLTQCVKHGKVKPADNRKAGRALGSASERAIWCSGCKADARKAAAKADKSEPASEPAGDATSDAGE
ncbi:MAG TPA: hypothetical protein VFF43_18125 [Caldimonas sp.]|nr:hypothetical protein [Caldimonas sp.]